MELTKSIVGVYNSHINAIEAVKALKEAGLSEKNISLIGKADVVDEKLHASSADKIKNAPVLIGIVLGPLLGLLAGASIVAIPGLGFIYGAGAVIGIIGGFDLGLIGGGIGTILMSLGINKEHIASYHEHLEKGRYLIIVHGNQVLIDKTEKILGSLDKHIELKSH